MVIIGITGAMGSGKSTAARMLSSFNIPLWDADKEVKILFSKKIIQEKMADLLDISVKNISFQKEIIKKYQIDENILEKIEQLLQPYLIESRKNFMKKSHLRNIHYVAWDIPLLFERKRDILCNAIWVTAVSPLKRERRIQKRPYVSAAFYGLLQKRQIKDQKKRIYGDSVIYSGNGHGDMFRSIFSLLTIIYRKKNDFSSQTRNYIRCGNNGPFCGGRP